MSISLGDAILYLGTDQSGLKRGLGQAESNTRKWSNKLGGIARAGITAAVVGAGAAIVGATALLVKSVQEGADMYETLNKEQVTFGDATDAANKKLADFAGQAGRSKYDLIGMATDLGTVVKGMGGTGEQAAELSTNLAQLATDVGSFQNAQNTDVMDAFRSAITGEFEPLKKYGIVLNQTRVQNELMKEGIKGNWAEIDNMSKAQAIYNLLMESTTDAQGDAIRTSGSWSIKW